MPKLLSPLLFILLIQFIGKAQTSMGFNVISYTTENGLPSNGIKGLQWDERTNFLWIATEAGTVRFNGVDFKSYTRENMQTIGSERMLFMTKNHRGNIRIADQTGNIFLINKSKPVPWRRASEKVNPYYDQFYLLTASDSFFLHHVTGADSSSLPVITSMIASINDTAVYVLHANTLFYQSLNMKKPVPVFFPENTVSNIFKIGDQCFIANTRREVFLLDHRRKSVTPVNKRNENNKTVKFESKNSLLFWQNGMQYPVLIADGNAWLLTYDGKEISTKHFFTDIPTDALIRFVQYSEKNGLLFIGTDSKGILVFSRDRVESKRRQNADPRTRNSYYSQVALDDENILTNEGDVIGNSSATISSLPINGRFEYYVSLTDDTLLWYSQANLNKPGSHLCQYNYKTGSTKIFEKIRWTDVVTSLGNKYYLANYLGIGVLEEDSLHFLYKYPGKNNLTFDMTEVYPGVLAIATCNGLFQFNTKTHTLDTLFSKEGVCVRSIWKYGDYLFFGTYGDGFFIHKKDGETKQMPLDKNKYLLYAHCFVPDDKGFCWISSNRGLFKVSLADLIHAFENNATSLYYHYFGKNDGMEMTELNGGCKPCALRIKNNRISFPTMDGLLWVNPDEAISVMPDGEIFVDEILIDNKLYHEDSLDEKYLPAKTREITIRLAVSAWCNKENIYLEYQLNDTLNWMPLKIDDDAVIQFHNLPPGDYFLQFRKLNGFGINNYSYKTIRFHITTPWHKQWWFNLLLALVVVALIWLYVRLRTRQLRLKQRKLEKLVAVKTKELQQQNEVLEKNNTIKTRLISIISHDIVTPLKFLTAAGKNLIAKRKQMSETLQNETIHEMTNTSQELQLLSTNILNWIKYQNENRRLTKEQFNLHELVNQVLGILQTLARQKNIIIQNQVSEDLEIYQYYEPLKILVYNLLTNSINFTEKGFIIVSADKNNNEIIVSVEDEGVGMSPEQIQRVLSDEVVITAANVDNKKGHGLGYLIIKDLLKTMDATIGIRSKKGEGTRVEIKMDQ